MIAGLLIRCNSVRRVSQLSATNRSSFSKSPNFLKVTRNPLNRLIRFWDRRYIGGMRESDRPAGQVPQGCCQFRVGRLDKVGEEAGLVRLLFHLALIPARSTIVRSLAS